MSIEKIEKNTKVNKRFRQSFEHHVSENKSSKGLLERSKYSLDLVNDWIVSADSKISTSCGIVSVAVAVLVFVAENMLSKIDIANKTIIESWETWFFITAICAVITFLFSLFFHFFALNPSFFSGHKKNENSEKKKCNIFYEDIKEYKNAEEYISAARKMSEDQFIDDALREIYANSIICSKKMHRFRIGLWCAFATIMLIFICSFCYFMIYQPSVI
jgi:hypothetical protein